jgi:chromosome partitioning protein
MQIIAVANQKGGVGKTTISVNLAWGLAMAGKRTLLIDLDHQAHTTYLFPMAMHPYFVEDLFWSKVKITTVIEALPNFLDGKLVVIPSSIALAKCAEEIVFKMRRETILKNHFKHLEKKNFDFVILDCPPSFGVITQNAIYAADKFLIPVKSSPLALEGVYDLFSIIKDVKEFGVTDLNENKVKIIQNVHDARTTIANNFAREQLNATGDLVAQTIIKQTESINQSQINKTSIFTFDPKGRGAEDFKALATEVMEW